MLVFVGIVFAMTSLNVEHYIFICRKKSTRCLSVKQSRKSATSRQLKTSLWDYINSIKKRFSHKWKNLHYVCFSSDN